MAALTFVEESRVVFRYRLAQSERNWVETRQRELNYLKLPPGQYTLEVMARDAQGIWSGEPARMHFEIRTPWFLAWWFRIGSGLAALLFGHLLWRRRTHRLERRAPKRAGDRRSGAHPRAVARKAARS